MNMKLPYVTWRSYSSLRRRVSVKNIRNRFFEYFVDENQHRFVKGIPGSSIFDHSTDLIYSGAHQFIRVFTGEEHFDPCCVANSQKCVKLKKSIDALETFYHDRHSLLFFEMLTNCSSLEVCEKKKFCELAWSLLTSSPFRIPPEKLFVSYFCGSEKHNLPVDEEVRDIWLELGVPADHVLPHDGSSNFWKLGPEGPCGTSTKIHFALPDGSGMLELWNMGFLKYNCVNDELRPLPNEYVSAGLGLERLASVLQRTYSCYHIDLFEPLFVTIQKISGAPEYSRTFVDSFDLDSKYRQLADLCRTITVAVSDNTFPDTNKKIKRILRKALYIARTDFKQQHPHHMLMELSARVVETLQDVYPETGENLKKVQLIIENEEYIVQDVIANEQTWWSEAKAEYPFLQSDSFLEYPETVVAFRHILKVIDRTTSNELPASEIAKVRDKCGIPRAALEKILEHFDRTVNWYEMDEVHERLGAHVQKRARQPTSIEQILLDVGITSDDSLKHNYVRNDNDAINPYTFPAVKSRLLAIVDGEEILSVDAERDRLPDSLKKKLRVNVCIDDREFGFVFDRTNFTTEGGNRYYDSGCIVFDSKFTFKVNRVRKIQNLVIHYAVLLSSMKNVNLNTGSEAILSIDAESRFKIMQNNTLSHLLLIALQELFPVVYLKYKTTSHENCQLKVAVLGKDVDVDECGKLLETKVHEYIHKKLPIRTESIETSLQLLQRPNVLYHPNLVYPYENIRLTAILDENQNEMGLEPCDNVHVFNTADVGEIVIPFLNYKTRKSLYVTGITGDMVTCALNLENWLQSQMIALQDEVETVMNDSTDLNQLVTFGEKIYPLFYKVTRDIFYTPHLITRSTYAESQRIKDIISKLDSKFSTACSEIVVEILRSKIEKLAVDHKFAVYFCSLPVPFFKQLSFFVDILYTCKCPALFLCYHRGRVKGVCRVPEDYATSHFNAEIWMKSTVQSFDNNLEVKEEVENQVFCYLKGERVKLYDVMSYMEPLTLFGRRVAEEQFVSDLVNSRETSFQDRG